MLLLLHLVKGLFSLVLLLLNQWRFPPLKLQASHCSTFHIMCDVPSIAVFCSESIECFPSTASKFFLKLLVTIPVAPIITGIIVHSVFHIRCLSLYINSCILASFPLPLHAISVRWYCHVYQYACFLLFVFN